MNKNMMNWCIHKYQQKIDKSSTKLKEREQFEREKVKEWIKNVDESYNLISRDNPQFGPIGEYLVYKFLLYTNPGHELVCQPKIDIKNNKLIFKNIRYVLYIIIFI